MAQVVIFVLDNLEQCSAVLEAWEEADVPGVTILESIGLRRLRSVLRDDLPLLPSLSDLLAGQEYRHRTLFTVVADEAAVERVIVATEGVVGDLTQDDAGLLFVVPATRVLGLEKRRAEGT